MDQFAHNGVQHGGAAEAAAHSLIEVVLIVIAVSAVVAILLTGSLFLLKKLAVIEIPKESSEEQE